MEPGSLVLCIWLPLIASVVAFDFSPLSNATLSPGPNTSTWTTSVGLGLTSPSQTSFTPSNFRPLHQRPNSNSRGDYVTTQCTTQHPTFMIPLGFTQTEDYGNGIVLVGPTTWSTYNILTFPEVANDLTTPYAPQPYEINVAGIENKTMLSSLISYGRGPDCTSAFLSYAASHPSTTGTAKSAGMITLPNGQTTMTVVYTTFTNALTSWPHCCGVCSLYFNNLQMLYWPAPHPNTACLGKMSAELNSTTTSAGAVGHNQSIYATDSDGYIFTSPSIYVKFPTVSATDGCGLIGSAVTSITLAFSPGELSTFVWNDGSFTSVLDTADLPCGPWNGTNHFLPEEWSNSSYYQPLIVLPSKLIDVVPVWKSCTADIFEGQDPPRTLSPAAALVPAPTNADKHDQISTASPSPSIPHLPLKTGAGDHQSADPGSTPDPPSKPTDPSVGGPGDPTESNRASKVDSPSAGDTGGLNGAHSPSGPNDPSTGDRGDSTNDNLPLGPNDPSIKDPGDPSDMRSPAEYATSPALPPAPNPTQTLAGDPPANGLSNPPATDPSTRPTPLTLPLAVGLQGHIISQGAAPVTIENSPVVYQSGSIGAGGEIHAVPTDWGQESENASPIAIGGLTFSAIPFAATTNTDPQTGNNPATNPTQMNDAAVHNPDSSTYITIGNQVIAIDANAISVAGTTLKPGDPGLTIDGTPISLGSSVFVIGSLTEPLSPPQTALTAQPHYITLDSHTISLLPNAIIINGTTLRPTDPAITVDGDVVSLNSSVFIVGTYTQKLILPTPTPTPTPAPSYLTFAGATIAAAASNIVIAGHTLTPGSPAVVANGTLVSLGPSILIIGTQTTSFTLPTTSAVSSTSEDIGALILKGLGGMGAGSGAAATETAGFNGSGGGDGAVVFMGGGRKGESWFMGLGAWVWVVVVLFV